MVGERELFDMTERQTTILLRLGVVAFVILFWSTIAWWFL